MSQRAGQITAAGHTVDMLFTLADPVMKAEIDAAYRHKYAGDIYLSSMISRRAQAAAAEIAPRVTDHCGRLQITDDNLDPKYVLLALRASRVQYGFDRVYRASLGNVRSDVIVPVPLADDGSFALERQREIADRLSHLYKLKSASVEATRYVASAKLSATLTGL